ncbi:MAG: EFR1 family ferrodoxin [Bacteroidaceae bacterium]
MNIVLLYYSGAGNTKYIAQKMLTKLNERFHYVELSRITHKPLTKMDYEIDLFIVAFPIMNFEAPRLVTETIQQLQAMDKPIAYLCTKAFMSAEAIAKLSTISTQHGLRTVAKLDLYMPSSDGLAFLAKKGSKLEKVFKGFHSRNIGLKLDRFIKKSERNRQIKVYKKWYSYLSFLIPKKTKRTIDEQFTKFIPRFHVLNDSCVQCMLCVHNCPEENIRFEEGEIKFGSNCDMCLKCLHHCPVDAIQIGNLTTGKSRYNKVEVPI